MPVYKARLKDDRFEWLEKGPEIEPGRSLDVQIVVEETDSDKSSEKNGAAMAEILEQLATRGTFSGIDDPRAWQHEMRHDRTLPGRTE